MDMHQQVRQDVVIDLRDLTPEERQLVLDHHLATLSNRYREAEADRMAAEEWAKRAAICREQEELKLANQRAEEVHNHKYHDMVETREREWQRPSRMHYVEVTFDEERKQFVAAYCGVTAYGDSPEMACDNFDHLWLYGN